MQKLSLSKEIIRPSKSEQNRSLIMERNGLVKLTRIRYSDPDIEDRILVVKFGYKFDVFANVANAYTCYFRALERQDKEAKDAA